MTTAVSAEDRVQELEVARARLHIARGVRALLLAIADHSIKDADEAFALLARRELNMSNMEVWTDV